ncbi:MAG: hypothetical protein ACM3SU_14395 [Acidobacteriota bacterium]
MRLFVRVARVLLVAPLLRALPAAGAPAPAHASPASGTAPFVFDGNRLYAELSFVRPDGSIHRALAFVDMGSPSMEIRATLFKELELDRGRPLTFKLGSLRVNVPSGEVTADPSEPRSIGPELKVEATLPAGVMQRYEVVLDYRRRTLTFATPGTIEPEGTPVPFRINPRTGLITVNALIHGEPYPATIDNGSAYTWFRQDTVRRWLATNPGWERGVGAVGASNMMMSGDGAEAAGLLLRIPEIAIGPLTLKQVGALGAGRGKGFSGDLDLFDWYSTKNAVPVIGWIGGNVLKAFRLTIDYPNRTMFWLRQSEPDATDLDQVGITLKRQAGEYLVAAVATKNGRPTVQGVQVGDRLIRVDHLETKGATLGMIYDALHGKPGEGRVLGLQRGGAPLTVRATVTAF